MEKKFKFTFTYSLEGNFTMYGHVVVLDANNPLVAIMTFKKEVPNAIYKASVVHEINANDLPPKKINQ